MSDYPAIHHRFGVVFYVHSIYAGFDANPNAGVIIVQHIAWELEYAQLPPAESEASSTVTNSPVYRSLPPGHIIWPGAIKNWALSNQVWLNPEIDILELVAYQSLV